MPYHVSVAAVNRAGQGEIRTTINFTHELSKSSNSLIHALLNHFAATSISPTNVSVKRISPTAMVVSWQPLTLTEARGFVSHYTVTYSPQIISGGRKKQVAMMVEVEGMDSNSTTITDLDPNTVYEVQVSASTGAGGGNFSEPIQATLFLKGIICVQVYCCCILLSLTQILQEAVLVVLWWAWS